ncbi:BZ3500_MvSof-1268-A1-R1_Chr2-2g05125 [Microbotryum saponariae]|uniref:BZ3500_MvSof-1268-A1-R1_Chr2-2g05125 protein n=1 Tax=Microbotryum saponariae TaxID=289078 RepID=A0A2X0N1T6_9BASI|nr:BZ3500_MvSof-1268-A1-R1_Chr2-2g05125 [Microbotryum saponariae]SDA00952.1 BZ3501_MvSof-1269-A2-R1_Chr2-2g04799 [Microbotryum saponariae]
MRAVHVLRLSFSLLLSSTAFADDVLKPLALYGSGHAIEGVLSPLSEQHSLDPQHLPFALDLQDEELLIHAGDTLPTNDFTVALMNLETSEVQKRIMQIINMQRFTTLLSDVKCGEPFTAITFQSRNAFEYAANAWDWVNSNDKRHIQMIPFWKNCLCDQGSYRPFRFHRMTVDTARLTILLEGIELQWENAMHAFDMHITGAIAHGDTLIPPASSKPFEIPDDFILLDQPPSNISTFDDEKLFGIHIPKWFKRAVDVLTNHQIHTTAGYSVHLDYTAGTRKIAQNSRKRQPGILFDVGCISCHSSGLIRFAIDIRWTLLTGIESFGASATAEDVKLVTVLDSKLSSTTVSSLDYSQTLFNFPVPGIGINIPKVFTAGFNAKFKFGLSISNFQGRLGLTYGIAAIVPNNAHFYIDLAHMTNHHQTSFAPQINHRPAQWTADASGTASFSLAAGIGLEFNLLNKFKYELGVALKAPVFKLSLAIVRPQTPPCRLTHRAVAISVSVGLAFGWKAGKGGSDFSVTHPIGRRALLDGRADVEDVLRIPRALIDTPVGYELPPTQDYLDLVMDELVHTMTPILQRRGTGWAVGMTIWGVEWPLITNLCILAYFGHRRDLEATMEDVKPGRKSIAF